MAIVTHPVNSQYRKGFDDALGRRCLLCRKPVDRDNEAEWEGEAHKACEDARAEESGGTR